jgi:hypothetical protein
MVCFRTGSETGLCRNGERGAVTRVRRDTIQRLPPENKGIDAIPGFRVLTGLIVD